MNSYKSKTERKNEGKYITFCVAKDKGRKELFATKIISAKVGSGISAVEVVVPGLFDYITQGLQKALIIKPRCKRSNTILYGGKNE